MPEADHATAIPHTAHHLLQSPPPPPHLDAAHRAIHKQQLRLLKLLRLVRQVPRRHADREAVCVQAAATAPAPAAAQAQPVSVRLGITQFRSCPCCSMQGCSGRVKNVVCHGAAVCVLRSPAGAFTAWEGQLEAIMCVCTHLSLALGLRRTRGAACTTGAAAAATGCLCSRTIAHGML
jgi:hypothetical protein